MPVPQELAGWMDRTITRFRAAPLATIATALPAKDALLAPWRHPAVRVAVLGLALAGLAGAQEEKGAGVPPPPPPPAERERPPRRASDLDLSLPAVRIVDRDNHQIEEYSVGNNVYMVKVKPKNAPPYYLVDESGSGTYEWRRGPATERLSVPQWAIIRW